MSLVERCFWCDELDPYGTHRCDKEWTMTDFTREEMRERIARRINDVDVPWSNYEEIADAIMDELGLWEAYEALIKVRALLPNLAQILDAWQTHPDWTEWDSEQRRAITETILKCDATLVHLRGETK